MGGGGCWDVIRLSEATQHWNAASADLILCYNAELVVFCVDSQYRRLLAFIELSRIHS